MPVRIQSTTSQQSSQEYPMGTNSFFRNWCWKNWTAACLGIGTEYYLPSQTKINSNGFKHKKLKP